MPFLRFDGLYTPELCRLFPITVFLFGDNCERYGEAGQACIRREPNAFGIPTKRSPTMRADAFFADDSVGDRLAMSTAMVMALAMAENLKVVVPVDPTTGRISLGTGLSRLLEHAPSLYALLAQTLKTDGVFRA